MTSRPPNIGRRLKVGAKWSGAEILLNLPLRLATLAILARLLTPTEFGIFAAAVTVIEFARPIGSLSIDHALVQSKSLSPESIAFASLFAIGLSSIVGMLIAANADAVRLLYDDPDVPSLLAVLAVSVPLSAISGLLLAVLRRKLAFRELSITVLLSSAAAALTSVAVAVLGGGVWALVAGYYVDLVLRALFAMRIVRPRLVRPGVGNEARRLLRFGGGTTLSLTLNFWALHGDYVVIGSALGAKPLGFYSRAYQLISTVPGMLGNLHNMVLFPAFSRAQSDETYLQRALLVGTEATAALTLPLCAWGLVLGAEIIFVLLGPGWEEAILPFQILSLGVYFRTGYRFAASIVWAKGRVFALSACQGVYGLLIVVGAAIGARWGIAGVAVATLVALFVFYVLLYGLTARTIGASIGSFLGVHLGPSLIFLIVLVTAAPVRWSLVELGWPPVAVLVAAVAVSAAGLLAATWGLRQRLWGELVYEQGLKAVGRYTSRAEGDDGGDNDVGT